MHGEGERVRRAPQVRAPQWSVTGHRHRLHARRGRSIRRRFGEALLHTVRVPGLLRQKNHRQTQLWLHHESEGNRGAAPSPVVQRGRDQGRFAPFQQHLLPGRHHQQETQR